MRISRLIFFYFMAILVAAGLLACRKNDKINTSPDLTLVFSTDTVFFDTVFATVGSITQRLVVYNQDKNKVRISTIRLSGGESSSYRLNINGTFAASVNDVEIPGEDSIYIFVRVTVNPQDQSTPYVIADSIEFITNTNLQQVKLVSWGKDAVFHRNASLQGNLTWDSLKAHVIYGMLRIDTNASLIILPGTKVYFHMNASMALSYGSSLKIPGTLEHPVRFQGDRMDPYYKDLPGQWAGIYLEKGSFDHVLNYTYIKNGMFGLAVDSLGSQTAPMLTLTNSIIQNMSNYGIYAYGASISAINCVIGDCGRNCLSVNYGGEYYFKYLTVGNYWYASVRNTPSIYLSNYSFNDEGVIIHKPLSAANFINTIIYGSNEDEIGLDSTTTIEEFRYKFDHAILKTQLKTTNPLSYINCIINNDPRFVDESAMNYQIDSISPAIKAGKEIGVPLDIRGNMRGQEPALGAYEYVKNR